MWISHARAGLCNDGPSRRCVALLEGWLEDKPEIVEPIAWVNTNGNRRAFYTSLGSPEDFKDPAFRRLLLNAVLWAVGQPVPPEMAAARGSR